MRGIGAAEALIAPIIFMRRHCLGADSQRRRFGALIKACGKGKISKGRCILGAELICLARGIGHVGVGGVRPDIIGIGVGFVIAGVHGDKWRRLLHGVRYGGDFICTIVDGDQRADLFFFRRLCFIIEMLLPCRVGNTQLCDRAQFHRMAQRAHIGKNRKIGRNQQ